MNLLKQPNRWTCLPTSAAMILDVELAQVIERVGHDGSEILWPHLPDPVQRRSFHIEEIQYVALSYGKHLVPFIGKLEYGPQDDLALVNYDFTEKLRLVLSIYDGILLGNYVGRTNRHAVAWNAKESEIYDPAGNHAELSTFSIWAFYALVACCGRTVGA